MKKQTRQPRIYDLVVIGSGAAGFSAAEVAASEGASVCLIEKGKLGGECPNYACVPTKSLLKSARTYYYAKHHLEEYGVFASNVGFSFGRMMARKDAVIRAITGNGERMQQFADQLGIEVVKGTASFVDSHTVQVAGKKIKAKKIIIATGSISYIPPIVGLSEVNYLDYKSVMELKRRPSSIVIVGGGPVACEAATFFSFLGCKVTLLEIASRILNREEEEISAEVVAGLEKSGAKIYAGTKTLSVKYEGRRVSAVFQTGTRPRQTILADKILIAAGKYPNLSELQIKKAGLKVEAKGRLVVKSNLATSVPHIFVAGDVSGGRQFTHVAHHEGYIAAVNTLAKTKRQLRIEERVVPRVIFTDPEIAAVGLTAKEATQRKKKYKQAVFPVGALGRAVVEGDRRGFIKILVENRTKQILGASMIGRHAGEVIHELALAMQAKISADELRQMIHAYPTFSEVIVAALSKI